MFSGGIFNILLYFPCAIVYIVYQWTSNIDSDTWLDIINGIKWVCPKLEEKKQQFWAPENTNMMIHREKFEAASPNSVPPRRRLKRFLERKTCFTWTAGSPLILHILHHLTSSCIILPDSKNTRKLMVDIVASCCISRSAPVDQSGVRHNTAAHRGKSQRPVECSTGILCPEGSLVDKTIYKNMRILTIDQSFQMTNQWRSMEVNGNVIIQTSTFSLQHQMHNSPQIWPLLWRLQPLWAPQKLRLRTCDVASHGSVRCCGIWTFVHQFFWIMGCQVWLEQVGTCWNMLEHAGTRGASHPLCFTGS